MPIKPENKKRYPDNWSTYIRPEILKRADHRCEGSPAFPECRAKNGVAHPITGSTVVLTIAHLDHQPENCDGMQNFLEWVPVEESNLRAWCQLCHNTYDQPHRTRCDKTLEMFV